MRSNDSIAQLACALAKAQIELVNPPKSLTAHFDGDGNGSPGQSYRYAPFRPGSTSCARPSASMRLRSCRRPTWRPPTRLAQ